LAVGSTRLRRAPESTASKSQANWLGLVVTVAVLAIGATWGYQHFSQWQHRRELAAKPAEPTVRAPTSSAAPTAFICDGRTHCSQMTSCAEAKWFINNCPGTKMDGNNDGIPCQEQWCN
jgi:hypothetical protein